MRQLKALFAAGIAGSRISGPVLAPGFALAAGLVLLPLLSLLDRAAAYLAGLLPGVKSGETLEFLALFGPALVEEAAKFLLVWGFVRPSKPRRDGASLALVAIGVFAAAENLSYQFYLGGEPALGRLLWSTPVHLISALAYAGILGAPTLAPRWGRAALAFIFVLGWHLGANALASGSPGPLIFSAVCLANILALLILARSFFDRILFPESLSPKGYPHD